MEPDRATTPPAELTAALGPLTAAPERAGVFFDLDGTLAPIVDRPERAAVPARSRELLERIGARYRLAGVVTGRQATEARRIVGLDGLTYVGNHGFELLRPRAAEEPAPALVGLETVAAEHAAALDRAELDRAGLRVEDKAAIVALHWRGAPDEDAAAAAAREIAARAEAGGLVTHWGRKVLELRPPVRIDKGIGLVSVIAESDVRVAFYAGDDRTDVDAFRALAGVAAAGRLDAVVRVAVDSEETPAEVAEQADLAVAGPEGFVAVLEALA
jgi:trehalose 6-phosphate phosphatase